MMKKLFHMIVYILAIFGLIMLVGFIAIKLHWTNVTGIVDSQHDYFKDQIVVSSVSVNSAWISSPEWQSLKIAILKDRGDIDRAATVAQISPRLIVAPLIVEQLRLFTDNRDLFKSVFEPLKILGVQNQFSWGVMGIKEDTAKQIEDNLKSSTSTFYLGSQYEHLLDSTSTDSNIARFNRLTDSNDRYYSYLYTALYEKELMRQWQNAGFDISSRPEILFTLFNIGFSHSIPHYDPQVGGAEIKLGSTIYSFGGLAAGFYNSSELPEFSR
jgi:hypothetical protein